jgi:hypothetical protein
MLDFNLTLKIAKTFDLGLKQFLKKAWDPK